MANWSEKALAEWANKNLDYLVTSRPTGVNLKIECASLKGEKKKSPFLSAGHLYLYNLDSVITFWMSGNVGQWVDSRAEQDRSLYTVASLYLD